MATTKNVPPTPVTLHDPLHQALRNQLQYRRQVLSSAAAQRESSQYTRLLREVDAALDRLEAGSYGICELCHEPVEDQQLLADPLVRFCFGHLRPEEQTALERDLELAAQIQARLLPARDFFCHGWRSAYHYKPLGVVSGDYLDLVPGPDNDLYFMLGDVSGKGVAASMLMSNLSAMFRSLIPLGLPLEQLMERANRVFTASTLPTQFATLVCGRALPSGRVEVSSAGHVPVLVIGEGGLRRVESHGLPLGLFAGQSFASESLQMARGQSLVLFSDGISEAQRGEEQYGEERIGVAAKQSSAGSPGEVVQACVRDLAEFLGSTPVFDDQTLMVVQRGGEN